jgi:hypothetical protein
MPVRGDATRNEREVGRVTSVSSFRVTVLLDPEMRSQVRAYSKRIAVVTQIGSYLLFPVAPGELAVGIIVSAAEDESIEPDSEQGMTLQLTRARRVLRLNLLGQLVEDRPFSAGVSVYPTLETPALLPTEEELKRILEFTPKDIQKDQDTALPLGISPIYTRQQVTGSYNDLLARPLGIIGNTGSGKSYSVASLIQAALKKKAEQAKFIVLDINGEYGAALNGIRGQKWELPHSRELNKVYINGKVFSLPLWVCNLNELIAFFEASQASQVPVLERVITSIREDAIDPGPVKALRQVMHVVDQCLDCLDGLSAFASELAGTFVSKNASAVLAHLEERMKTLAGVTVEGLSLHEEIKKFGDTAGALKKAGLTENGQYNCLTPTAVQGVEQAIQTFRPVLEQLRQDTVTVGGLKPITADSPVPFDPRGLQRDALFHIAVSRFRGQERIQEYIATLRLRIHRQLSDKRWSVFTEPGVADFETIMKSVSGSDETNIVIVDCSMLAYDVLPFFCAVLGRLILELRAHTEPPQRTFQPFVLVLEEAHNYLKPGRENESHGARLSREAFERIAKEGRKFGLSLIIASQRPSDVSATVLSQCANFVVHRIQNPEDIDYFKKILPTGSRDVLDQLPILAPGDGLLIGSAINVPARVKVTKPSPEPQSETPKPWRAWQQGQPGFDLKKAISSWIQETGNPEKQ